MDQHPSKVWTHEPASLDTPELSVMARSMIAARRALHGPLPSTMIHDPALDILLALFVAGATASDNSEEDLLGRTTVASSTAIRWIRALEQAGLVVRASGIVKLSGAGVAAVTNTLLAVARSQWHLDEDR